MNQLNNNCIAVLSEAASDSQFAQMDLSPFPQSKVLILVQGWVQSEKIRALVSQIEKREEVEAIKWSMAKKSLFLYKDKDLELIKGFTAFKASVLGIAELPQVQADSGEQQKISKKRGSRPIIPVEVSRTVEKDNKLTSIEQLYKDLDDLLEVHGIARQRFEEFIISEEGLETQKAIAAKEEIEVTDVVRFLGNGKVHVQVDYCDRFVQTVASLLAEYLSASDILDDFDTCIIDHFYQFDQTKEATKIRGEIRRKTGVEAVDRTKKGEVRLAPEYKDFFVAWLKELEAKSKPRDLSEEPIKSFGQLFSQPEAGNAVIPETQSESAVRGHNQVNNVTTQPQSQVTSTEESTKYEPVQNGPFKLIEDLHEGCFLSLKQFTQAVNEELSNIGSSVTAKVGNVNNVFKRWGWQKREANKWIAVGAGKKHRRGNQWHNSLIEAVANELSVVYLTAKQLRSLVLEKLERTDITPNVLSAALAKMELQERVEVGNYRKWVPGIEAITKDGIELVRAVGSKVAYHPRVVNILVDNSSSFVASLRNKVTKDDTKFSTESFGLRFAIATLGKTAELGELLIQSLEAVAEQLKPQSQQELEPTPFRIEAEHRRIRPAKETDNSRLAIAATITPDELIAAQPDHIAEGVAIAECIRGNYRNLSKKLHPDSSTFSKPTAERSIRILNAAKALIESKNTQSNPWQGAARKLQRWWEKQRERTTKEAMGEAPPKAIA